VDSQDILEKTGGKIGTYGVIKGAQDYIIALVEEGEKDLEQLGYVLEELILYATSIGLGTCWLGGTFKKSDFSQMVSIKENEKMLIVTPIGYPEDKKSVTESFMRFAVSANQRKSWAELFYSETFSASLKENGLEDIDYVSAFEAVRLGPSASNKQPWRILKNGNTFHFYLLPNKGYGDKLGYNIQKVDMGIAMCHFEMVIKELGIKGSWENAKPKIDTLGLDDIEYIVSWIGN
jgi:hypothetical protein